MAACIGGVWYYRFKDCPNCCRVRKNQGHDCVVDETKPLCPPCQYHKDVGEWMESAPFVAWKAQRPPVDFLTISDISGQTVKAKVNKTTENMNTQIDLATIDVTTGTGTLLAEATTALADVSGGIIDISGGVIDISGGLVDVSGVLAVETFWCSAGFGGAATLADISGSLPTIPGCRAVIEQNYFDISGSLASVASAVEELKTWVSGVPVFAPRVTHFVRIVLPAVDGSEGADLSGADLSGADLSGADLSGADLSGADLSGAIAPQQNQPTTFDISGTLLEIADYVEGLSGEHVILTGIDSTQLDLSGNLTSVASALRLRDAATESEKQPRLSFSMYRMIPTVAYSSWTQLAPPAPPAPVDECCCSIHECLCTCCSPEEKAARAAAGALCHDEEHKEGEECPPPVEDLSGNVPPPIEDLSGNVPPPVEDLSGNELPPAPAPAPADPPADPSGENP